MQAQHIIYYNIMHILLNMKCASTPAAYVMFHSITPFRSCQGNALCIHHNFVNCPFLIFNSHYEFGLEDQRYTISIRLSIFSIN